MTIQAVNNRIILKRIAVPKNKNGLFLPDSANQEEPRFHVVSIGAGKYDLQGNLLPLPVKVGDIVMVDLYPLKQIKVDADELIVCKSDDIIGIINS